MAKILVHLRNSLEHPKRAALENPQNSPSQTCWFNSRLSTTACSLI